MIPAQPQDINPKEPIGQVLKRAGLISEAQIQIALMDQSQYGMLFGEILVSRGWLKPQTISFFLENFLRHQQSIGSGQSDPPPAQNVTPASAHSTSGQTPSPAPSALSEDLSRYSSQAQPVRTKSPQPSPTKSKPFKTQPSRTSAANPQSQNTTQPQKMTLPFGRHWGKDPEKDPVHVTGYRVSSLNDSEFLPDLEMSDAEIEALLE
jgi:hypothetical protein